MAAGKKTPHDDMDESNDDEKPAPVRAEAKPGRNEPCPCGSGKKYKKCCGKSA
jgi:preprotein translocase subunit SecA